MALDPVPTWIHGAKHSGDVLRMGTYNETGGAEGVSSPTAFQVRATETPSEFVRVAPGGLLLLSPWDEGQTYSVRNASETLVEVPASSSLDANTWYINAWVNDPSKPGGTAPVSKKFGPYNFLTCDPEPKDNNPAYACAQIDVPKNEATIDQDYITDLRGLAQPREKTYLYADPTVVATEEVLTDTTEKGELFPDTSSISPFIPEWATRVQIESEWLQVTEPGGDFNGRIWVEWGPYVEMSKRERKTQDFGINGNGVNNFARRNWKVAQDMFVPSALRGTKQVFFLKARLISHSGASSRPKLDSASGIVLKLRFLEEVEQFEVNS